MVTTIIYQTLDAAGHGVPPFARGGTLWRTVIVFRVYGWDLDGVGAAPVGGGSLVSRGQGGRTGLKCVFYCLAPVPVVA